MMRNMLLPVVMILLFALVGGGVVSGQHIQAKPVDKWVTVTAAAAGTDEKAKDQAVAQALRTAVEQACGVFLTAQTKIEDYQTVYDKVFANAVGYVIEHKVLKTWADDEKTHAQVRVRVSTQKFEKNWAVIAHTIEQENNPRVIVAVVEAVTHAASGPAFEVKENGTVQGKIEDFFLTKGITLMDRGTATAVTKRDVLLAALKDDAKEVASLGARFKADVVVLGRATAKYGKSIKVGDITMYQYTATLNVRVIQTDSARVLASKSFGPKTVNSLQRAGGGEKALAKLAEDSAPNLLAAVVEAWRKRATVSRMVHLSVSGMDYAAWKAFRDELNKLRGVQALRLREITEGVAHVDVEYRYSNENLADHLTELKQTKVEVTEITANRIKLKVSKSE